RPQGGQPHRGEDRAARAGAAGGAAGGVPAGERRAGAVSPARSVVAGAGGRAGRGGGPMKAGVLGLVLCVAATAGAADAPLPLPKAPVRVVIPDAAAFDAAL